MTPVNYESDIFTGFEPVRLTVDVIAFPATRIGYKYSARGAKIKEEAIGGKI